MSPADLGIAAAARAIAARTLSPVELVRACIDRMARHEPQLHAFVAPTPEAALDAARACETEILRDGPRGPLHGIPFGVKDIIDVAGLATTAHSRLFADRPPAATDATVVARLRAAGVVTLGKLATHEFAMGGPSFDLPWPPARNPHDPSRFTGGSSSGTGAALAAGFVAGGLGTDTTGSIRSPAAFCGVVGLKPTFGRVSRRGVVPLAASLDHVGPMARSAEDCALVLQAIAGHDPLDPFSARRTVPDYVAALARGLGGLRIGVVRHFFERDAMVRPETGAAIDAALGVFRALGATVRDVTLPPLLEWHAVGTVILLVESHAVHAAALRATPERYGAILRERLRLGALVTAADYLQAQAKRRVLAATLTEAFRDVDLVLSAVQPGEAPPIDAVPANALVATPSWNIPFSITGVPAIALPCGTGPNGLPLALQIAARPFDEATLLAAAHAFERATADAGWRIAAPLGD